MKKFSFVSLVLALGLAFVSCGNGTTDNIDESILDQIIYVEANPSKGFNYGYYYYIPRSIRNVSKKYLLVEPNNCIGSTDDYSEIDNFAQNTINSNRYYSNRINVALLVPVFPRPRTNYITVTHALTSDTFRLSGELRRIDLQLISMIDDLKKICQDNGLHLESKFLMQGSSASGQFVNRFTAIYPELLQAVATGGVTGNLIIPTNTFAGENLIYPIGISNLYELTGRLFDFEQYSKVPQYIYIGSEDKENSPMPINDGSVPMPHSDMYPPDESRVAYKLFGNVDIITRWQICQNIITQLGCKNIIYTIYPGVGHAITNEMTEDITSFFRSNM